MNIKSARFNELRQNDEHKLGREDRQTKSTRVFCRRKGTRQAELIVDRPKELVSDRRWKACPAWLTVEGPEEHLFVIFVS